MVTSLSGNPRKVQTGNSGKVPDFPTSAKPNTSILLRVSLARAEATVAEKATGEIPGFRQYFHPRARDERGPARPGNGFYYRRFPDFPLQVRPVHADPLNAIEI